MNGNSDYDFGGVFLVPEDRTPGEAIKEELERQYEDEDANELKLILQSEEEYTAGYFFIDPLFAASVKLELPDSCGTDSAEYAIKDGWTQLCRGFEVPSSFTASEEEIDRYKERFK